jgi:outer membrane autotransporter protein
MTFPVTKSILKHSWLGVGLVFLPAASFSAETVLGSYGQTQLQVDTGDAVMTTCLQFIANGDGNASTGSSNLFTTCGKMVHSAVELSGGPNLGLSLGITSDELAVSLQQIATEEFAATQSMASEISNNQVNTAMGRLANLRSGVKGLSLAGNYPSTAPNTFYHSTGMAAGDDMSPLGMFVTGQYTTGDRDDTDRTDAFDFDGYSLTVGLDYKMSHNLILGGALTYHDIDSDFDKTPTVSGGDIDSDGWGVIFYGSWYNDNLYVDGMLGFGQSDYDIKRNVFIPTNNNVAGISEVAKADTDSDDFTASIGVGYDIASGNMTISPNARLTYVKVDVDGYREKGLPTSGLNLDVDGEDWDSLTSVIGAQLSWNISQDYGVLVPQVSAGWVHEFENDDQEFTATYIFDPRKIVMRARTDKPDRNYFEAGIGVSAVLKGGMQVFANYDTVLGFDDLDQHIFSLGARWEF